ncbi:Aste57867_23446 [Aphanomyces stellatus]|uniref:Aste57867_23446 protein n=1 Tax=Aphanomyces stellatus TaxID=120398 RepID=A0A485LMR2_9STRA|nr:hypothetical protein As57867_023375 [Aphanomyces stellatus]VFU00092.1 Aste57867_23446 [Aphanomyces stellatus]
MVGRTSNKRLAEIVRLRKFRELKKAERKALEMELATLEWKLRELQVGPQEFSSSKTQGGISRQLSAYQLAVDVLLHVNQSLRSKVKDTKTLAQVLATWVTSHHPQITPTTRLTWTDTTLMAHPVARRQGFHWLSERLYHAAIRGSEGLSRNEFDKFVDDSMQFEMHTTLNDDGNVQITRMDLHCYNILFEKFDTIAATAWNFLRHFSFGAAWLACNVEIDRVHGKLVYDHNVNPRDRTSLRRILCMFEEPNRVVITLTKVKDDELYALTPGERRTHGYAWYVIERLTDHMTLMKHSYINYIPTTLAGEISLEEFGELFGLLRPTDCHQVRYIESIRSAAERAYIGQIQEGVNMYRQYLLGCKSGELPCSL